MPELPHLILPRAEVNLDRRKRPGFGMSVPREPGEQATRISRAVDEALAAHANLRATIVDPELIVRVRTTHFLPEDEWIRAGLTVLGHDENDSVVLFASDAELTAFRARLAAYSEGVPEGQVNPHYASLIACIEEFGPLSPRDRIGGALRVEGYEEVDSLGGHTQFTLDVELWEIGTKEERGAQADALNVHVVGRGGEITDRYIGISFTALRVTGDGRLFQWLLSLPIVRVIDLPPQVDADVTELLETGIRNLGVIQNPDADAPLIAILDSGVNEGHPLLAPVVVEKASAPASLGLSDVFGHGSKVSGIAAYGDMRNCLETGSFKASIRICSGKVVNDTGTFDSLKLVPSQMNEIIRSLHARGCRIFNLSIGDRKARYGGGKVGTWTAILDELARELNVLIVVAAGNYEHEPAHGNAEDHLTGYPRYLTGPESRLLEPGVAANVLTVGAIASAAAVTEQGPGNVSVRPIANVGEPAPFTRCGPGVGEGLKPDLCDDGGNMLYDGLTQGLIRRPESEILTTHPRYLERLFTTGFGTSYAAPLVAHKAGQVLKVFPTASANLLRALLASSARLPEASIGRLRGLGAAAIRNACGYGIANAVIASTSDTNRVVLYADDTIGMDRFFVYEVPIPREFSKTKGKRAIKVTLAFDPPTRHTRAAYLGVQMSFRLVRGKTLGQIIDHYRQRDQKVEGKHPELEGKFDCSFDSGPNSRECGTLQSALFEMSRNPAAEYGDTYFLVVRCERKWSPDEFAQQRFALVVEMSHSGDIALYERIRERITVRVRA
jgi:subtilisin family serine protease